jgi:hypothetical protein
MRSTVIGIAMCLGLCGPVTAEVSLEIGLPSVRIGISIPVYPALDQVPGYPVYYAPQAAANLFFYDGLYWVYTQDRWYSSTWYNGPWIVVAPTAVPLFVLRVPVEYYQRPPAYFAGWSRTAPPQWGDHWGRSWAEQHVGWDQWDRRSAPAPAPLPNYQRAYSGSRYPQVDEQHVLRNQNYHYQPSEAASRRQFAQSAGHGAEVAAQLRAEGIALGALPAESQLSLRSHTRPSQTTVVRDLRRDPDSGRDGQRGFTGQL